MRSTLFQRPPLARVDAAGEAFAPLLLSLLPYATPSITDATQDSSMNTIDQQSLRQLFLDARTHMAWTDRPVDDATLRTLYDTLRWGPTAANCSPLRIVFVRSREAKEKLRPALSPGNADKTMAAPVTAILGHDLGFPDTLPKLFPHADARSWYAGNDPYIQQTAFRNGALQGRNRQADPSARATLCCRHGRSSRARAKQGRDRGRLARAGARKGSPYRGGWRAWSRAAPACQCAGSSPARHCRRLSG